MDNINLNGLTNEQFALYCATEIVNNFDWGEYNDANSLSYSLTVIAKTALDFLNQPAQFRGYLKTD